MATQTAEDLALMQQMAGQSGQKNNLLAVFSMEPVELAEDTKIERNKADPARYPDSIIGRPFYEDQEFITIYIPGDRNNVIFRPVRGVDRVQYADQYRAFKANKEQSVSGTPLEKLPFLSKSQCLELAYFGIKTAEQLVATADVNGQKIIGWAALKQRVQSFLDAAAGAAPAAKLQSELEKRDNEIASLKNMLDEQRKRLDGMTSKQKG